MKVRKEQKATVFLLLASFSQEKVKFSLEIFLELLTDCKRENFNKVRALCLV